MAKINPIDANDPQRLHKTLKTMAERAAKKEAKMKKEEAIDAAISFSPDLIKIVIKLIKFSKGGLSKAERQELGSDLLELAAKILEDII